MVNSRAVKATQAEGREKDGERWKGGEEGRKEDEKADFSYWFLCVSLF